MDSTDPAAQAPETVAGIQYAECPHCHHEVMVRPDHVCLACGKDQSDTQGANPDMTMLTIENVSKLPANCFLCGVETERTQTFSWTYQASTFGLPPWMVPLAKMMTYVPGSAQRTTEKLRLPTCSHCGPLAKKNKPLSVWSGLDCRLLVHRIFRERFEALNGKKPIDFEWEAETRIVRGTVPDDQLVAGGVQIDLKK